MEPSALEGRMLDERYQVLRHIGSGKMGSVYHGRDLVLDRDVAIKVLTGGDEAIRARFVQEARAMAVLSHPNIVAVFDFGEFEGLSYFVMEYVDGAMLRTALADRTYNFVELIAIFVGVLEALDFAHRRSVLHRDVKPGNILIDTEHQVKVTDFGLSRRMSDLSHMGRPGEIVGTISYLSPESFLGKPTDARGDLYSIGIVMYEAFTGSLPFTSATDDVVAVIFAHVNEVPVPPRALNRALPTALENLILRLMEKAPEARYARAADVARDLRAIAELPVTVARDASTEARRPAEPVDPGIRDLLDRMLSPQRATKEAFGNVVSAMLATRRRQYAEAAALFRKAIDEFRTLKNDVEQVKATIHFGECMVTSSLDATGMYDRAATRKAIDLVTEAIPIARVRGMQRELDLCERLLTSLTDTELRRR